MIVINLQSLLLIVIITVLPVDCTGKGEEDYMDWLKTNDKNREKSPEERLYIAKIQTLMEDSFGMFTGISGTMSVQQEKNMQQQAKDWFETKECAWFCEMAGTTHDHVIRLLQNLQYNYYSGKITKQQLKFGISRLELKL
jgi:hypothetical protein